MRYLRGTSNMCLCFGAKHTNLVAYTDLDMAGDVDGRRSISGYLMTYAGGSVSWQSRLQKCVDLSTTEAEFIAATEASKELLWVKKFMVELNFVQDKYVLYYDNASAIHLGKNPAFHARSKHIDVRYHWIRDALEAKQFVFEKIHTDYNGADMMTKELPFGKLEMCRSIAGMEQFPDHL